MPTILQTDTATVLTALAAYSADYAASGYSSAFPDRTVPLSEGAITLGALTSHVCAFAQGHHFDGKRSVDRGVIFTIAHDEDTDARLARTIAHRAHLIARERTGRRGR